MGIGVLVKSRRFILVFSYLCLLVCWPMSSHGMEQMYQISVTQYSELRMIITRQESRLETLQSKLNQLQKASTEQKQELTEALSQLQESKNQLAETKANLTNAKESLAKAEVILQEQEKSLTALEQQVKALEHKTALAKRQRNVWAAIAGASLIYAVAR